MFDSMYLHFVNLTVLFLIVGLFCFRFDCVGITHEHIDVKQRSGDFRRTCFFFYKTERNSIFRQVIFGVKSGQKIIEKKELKELGGLCRWCEYILVLREC